MFRGFREFEEDPFFRDHHEQMRNVFGAFDRPFGFNDPFALEGPRHQNERGPNRDRDNRRDLAPRDMFGDMFSHMNSVFGNMEPHFERAANNPNSYTYSQSSVMSYSNDGRGEPKYYQAHTATKKAPGGIKETQRAVKDSETGVERMAIGHHIGDRGHVVERSMNRRTNEEERKQDFINMDENDSHSFDNEWNHRTHTAINGLRDRRHAHRALEEPARHRHDHHRDTENREERRHHRPHEDHRARGEERGRGDERGRGEERRVHNNERRVRLNSRPVNRHAPRGDLD